jgi:anaphase-promoting complex subunit 8
LLSLEQDHRNHQTREITTGGSYIDIAIEDELADSAVYRFAKSFFHCRHYRRAAHVLRDQIDMKSLFLRFYALYLVSFPFAPSSSAFFKPAI